MTFNTGIGKMDEMARQHARLEFEAVLRRMPQMVGNRNNSLPWICRLGLRAGLDDEAVYDAIMRHCGQPRLTDCEVRRGIAAAHLPLGTHTVTHFIKCVTAERGFVRRMVEAGRGTTVEGLQRAAGLMPAAFNRDAAACEHVRAILRADRDPTRFDIMDKFWVGKDKNAGALRTAFDLINGMGRGDFGLAEIPNFITGNALTGEVAPTKDGQGLTRRGDNCVVAPRLMIVEFDELPREDQLAFVGGVLQRGMLRVVSVVNSGNRSLHVLVEVEGEYAAFREKVLRLMCSSEDPRERIDRAVLHPSALTRLAGAVRPDTGKVQELVWYNAG